MSTVSHIDLCIWSRTIFVTGNNFCFPCSSYFCLQKLISLLLCLRYVNKSTEYYVQFASVNDKPIKCLVGMSTKCLICLLWGRLVLMTKLVLII